MSNRDSIPPLPRWHPGDPEPHGPYSIANEDKAAWRRQFLPDVPPERQQHLIPVWELNEMMACIANGLSFEESPFASRPPHYREEWEVTKRNMEEIRSRGLEAVPENDPG